MSEDVQTPAEPVEPGPPQGPPVPGSAGPAPDTDPAPLDDDHDDEGQDDAPAPAGPRAGLLVAGGAAVALIIGCWLVKTCGAWILLAPLGLLAVAVVALLAWRFRWLRRLLAKRITIGGARSSTSRTRTLGGSRAGGLGLSAGGRKRAAGKTAGAGRASTAAGRGRGSGTTSGRRAGAGRKMLGGAATGGGRGAAGAAKRAGGGPSRGGRPGAAAKNGANRTPGGPVGRRLRAAARRTASGTTARGRGAGGEPARRGSPAGSKAGRTRGPAPARTAGRGPARAGRGGATSGRTSVGRGLRRGATAPGRAGRRTGSAGRGPGRAPGTAGRVRRAGVALRRPHAPASTSRRAARGTLGASTRRRLRRAVNMRRRLGVHGRRVRRTVRAVRRGSGRFASAAAWRTRMLARRTGRAAARVRRRVGRSRTYGGLRVTARGHGAHRRLRAVRARNLTGWLRHTVGPVWRLPAATLLRLGHAVAGAPLLRRLAARGRHRVVDPTAPITFTNRPAATSSGPPITPPAPIRGGERPVSHPIIQNAVEALRQVAGYTPENPEEFQNFVRDLPAVYESHAEGLTGLADRLGDEKPFDPRFLDHLRDMGGQMAGASDHAMEAERIYRGQHETEIARREHPRPGEEFWDVKNQ